MNKGILLVLSGYLMWGCFPLYWALLNHVNPSEVLIHRMLWAVPVLFFLVHFKSSWKNNFKESISSKKELVFLFITAILITINWGGYIYAVNLGRVVEASMGYFLSPVINMIGGYIFFQERISKLKQLAVFLATVGALYYVFSGDSFPWLGFLVGFTFSAYGIARKAMASSAVPGLYIETLILLPFLLIFSLWFYTNYDIAFFNINISTDILIIFSRRCNSCAISFIYCRNKVITFDDGRDFVFDNTNNSISYRLLFTKRACQFKPVNRFCWSLGRTYNI